MPFVSPVWHPCSQMKDYEVFPPLPVKSAKGCYIELEDGRKIIDAISSWWCKSLGHNHSTLKQALIEQTEKFEHVILANTIHQNIIELSKKLANLTQTLDKVMYASDGSSIIEIAIKMSIHARQILGQTYKTEIISLENSYHGETALALSVSDVGLYRKPYKPLLKQYHFVKNIPYVNSRWDPLWKDCSEYWYEIEKELNPKAHTLTAVIIEPIVQGTGGMRIYSQDFLKRLGQWCTSHDVHLIADEIMTGFGRTGFPLACQHAGVEPDFLCLGKGLTAGWLPMSALVTSHSIYQLFYDEYETGKAFMHSHTYAGNALAAAVALACFEVYEKENIYQQVQDKEPLMYELMRGIAEQTHTLHNVRYIGGVVAADIVGPSNQRLGYQVYRKAVELGALLRPLGNTLYWLPPLNITREELIQLFEITKIAVRILNVGKGG